uniref:DHC_N1 domain-containing protein n=1 Tax=Heterorhabditis bacteriophora TaxID=37862 RepID=A0A1I7WXE2_HETBA
MAEGKKLSEADIEVNMMTEDPEFYIALKQKDVSFYKDMKDLPDSAVKKYIPDIARRFIELERRIKEMETLLWALPREERSLEEDRFEILTELLDKACQGFDIWDEHAERKIRLSHRIVLETRLLHLISTKFDIITKVCEEFDKLRGNSYEVNNERDWLRYEIRHCDMMFTELHEQFLKSYLEMNW